MDNKEVKREYDYLNNVIKILRSQIISLQEKVNGYNNKIYQQNKEMWERANHLIYDFDDVAEYSKYIGEMRLNKLVQKTNIDYLRKYTKMLSSPYFGCVDFRIEGKEPVERMYFGITNLMNKEGSRIYVYDWRSPIAVLYYNGDIGRTSYDAPQGTVSGEIILRRQFKIVDGQIEYMFDTNVSIGDEMLCHILSGNADNRMKTIISSIQREQDNIIRDTSTNVLIVQGPAGSGKTSIALHRAAFLLYTKKDEISSQDIVVFSQNELFNSYISDVLPDLGEYDVLRLKIGQLFNYFFTDDLAVGDYSEQYELLLNKNNENKVRWQALKIKTSLKFMRFIQAYVWHYTPVFEDIYLGKVVVCSKKLLDDLYYNKFSSMIIGNRLRRIKAYIDNELEYKKIFYEKKIKKMKFGKDRIKLLSKLLNNKLEIAEKKVQDICSLDAISLYFQAIKQYISENGLSNGIYEYTQQQLASKVLPFEDATVLLYIRLICGDIKPVKNIRHVIIDEAQDYNCFLHFIIKNLFAKSSYTILGDINQSINSVTGITDLKKLIDIYNGTQKSYIEIDNSYRSTVQINLVAERLCSNKINAVYFERQGKPVEIISAKDVDDIIGKLISAKQKKYGDNVSIVVITKSKLAAFKLYSKLSQRGICINLVDEPEEDLIKGAVIMPIYLTKGLEFDHVIVYDASDDNYKFDLEQRLLYIAATRAMHSLCFVYNGNLSRYLRGMEDIAVYKNQALA